MNSSLVVSLFLGREDTHMSREQSSTSTNGSLEVSGRRHSQQPLTFWGLVRIQGAVQKCQEGTGLP